MKKLLLSVSVVMGMTAGQALAADIAPPPAFDWTGFYLGLNAGYAFNGYYGDDVEVAPVFGHVGSLDVNGWFGGAQAGYNYQFDQFVLGVEADIQGGNISDDDSSIVLKHNVTMSDDINWFGTLRGRAGFAFDRALIYATGGFAFGGVDYNVKLRPPVGAVVLPTINLSDSYTATGWAAGGGLEYAFDDAWSMKAEYLYVNLGDGSISSGKFKTHPTPDFQTVRVGINYRF